MSTSNTLGRIGIGLVVVYGAGRVIGVFGGDDGTAAGGGLTVDTSAEDDPQASDTVTDTIAREMVDPRFLNTGEPEGTQQADDQDAADTVTETISQEMIDSTVADDDTELSDPDPPRRTVTDTISQEMIDSESADESSDMTDPDPPSRTVTDTIAKETISESADDDDDSRSSRSSRSRSPSRSGTPIGGDPSLRADDDDSSSEATDEPDNASDAREYNRERGRGGIGL